jgi:hypothetical protein
MEVFTSTMVVATWKQTSDPYNSDEKQAISMAREHSIQHGLP